MMSFKTNKLAPSAQKLRGGYYTPQELADYLCRWAIRDGSERVLEPCCGDGNFAAPAAQLLNGNGSLTIVDIDGEEMRKARNRTVNSAANVHCRHADFFDVMPDLLESKRFDVILGNPPFIRFQHFDKNAREQAFGLLRTAGYKPTGLANAWSAFVQLSAELLRDGGRLAMVVPAELLQVQYSAQLRDRLPRLFDDVLIIAFDELVFPAIQQEVVLLLAEGRRMNCGSYGRLHTMQLRNGSELISDLDLDLKVSHLPERHTRKGMKWTSLFLDNDQFKSLDKIERAPGLVPLGKLANIDVGIVTGRNSFFLVSENDANRMQINGHALNVVGRTSALKSIRYSKDDARTYAHSFPSKILNLKGVDLDSFSKELKKYIRDGERAKINEGYKCRIRPRWYDLPSVYIPDAFMFRQIHRAPLLVANHARATATDTIHRVRVARGINVNQLCVSTVNSMTFAWAEICGRSYGGGVLELEPREAEELPVPYKFAKDVDRKFVDRKLRCGDITAVLDHTDDVLLREGCGLSRKDISLARSAWEAMRSRRQRRSRSTGNRSA